VDAGWPRVIQGKGRGVADIQGSEHAAKTLIVVNCQHIADINHKEYTERDFEISEKFLKGKNPTGLRSRRRFFGQMMQMRKTQATLSGSPTWKGMRR
jgi:hypothetical protein